jgi:hypothetical protein
MISATVSTISLTYSGTNPWTVFDASNLATGGNLQANFTDIASQINNAYTTAISSCISEVNTHVADSTSAHGINGYPLKTDTHLLYSRQTLSGASVNYDALVSCGIYQVLSVVSAVGMLPSSYGNLMVYGYEGYWTQLYTTASGAFFRFTTDTGANWSTWASLHT